jgi:type I site-specific restriction endonuclease
LKSLPELDESRLWKVQARAIRNLEESFGRADPRALIQMATGSGKTFTAVNVAYRPRSEHQRSCGHSRSGRTHFAWKLENNAR